MITVTLKNGLKGTLVGDVHIIFDNNDGYSYTVPVYNISLIEVIDFKREHEQSVIPYDFEQTLIYTQTTD